MPGDAMMMISAKIDELIEGWYVVKGDNKPTNGNVKMESTGSWAAPARFYFTGPATYFPRDDSAETRNVEYVNDKEFVAITFVFENMKNTLLNRMNV